MAFFYCLCLSFGLSAQTAFISEFFANSNHFEEDDFVEIAAPTGTSLMGWQIALYDGLTGNAYDTHTFSAADITGLTDTIDGQAYGVVLKNYHEMGIQYHENGGIALINTSNEVVQFLSYGGVFTASNGPAMGQSSQDIGSFTEELYSSICDEVGVVILGGGSYCQRIPSPGKISPSDTGTSTIPIFERCIEEDEITFDNPPPTLCEDFGQNEPDIVVTANPVTILDVGSFGGQWQNQTIEINGIILIQQDFDIDNCILSFAPGASIIIGVGANVRIQHSKLFACEKMWRGIRVQNGRLRFFNNEIEDAQYAINGGGNGDIRVFGNFFRRNHIGVRAVLSVSNSFSVGVFSQNIFQTSDVLNPPYDNQSPHPGTFSYAGVLMRNVNGATLHNSIFNGLLNGIILDQSTAAIRRCEFLNMYNIDYQEYPEYPRACGIVAIDSDLRQSGSDNFDFNNCSNAGIYTTNSDIISNGNHFIVSQEEHGYNINGARFEDIDIQNNRIEVDGQGMSSTSNDAVGIFTRLIGDEAINYEVSNNTIDVHNAKAVGISSTFNAVNNFNGNMTLNTINAHNQPGNSTAWFLSTNNLSGTLRIVDNDIFTNENCIGTGLTYDLSTGTSTRVDFIDNRFEANVAHSTDGIYAANSRGFINYCSNIFTNNRWDLTFLGNNLNSNVMYSTFDENRFGLVLQQFSFPTFIGVQRHHQNNWGEGACDDCAFEAFARLEVDVTLSRFSVDPTTVGFRPNPINRPEWFQNEDASPPPLFCSFLGVNVVNDADYILVNDEDLFSTDNVFAWDKKAYLYQKLAPYIQEDSEAAEIFTQLTGQLSATDIQLFNLPFDLNAAQNLSSEDRAQWNSFYEQKREIMDNILALDELILEGQSMLIASKTALVHQLTQLVSLEKEWVTQIDIQRKERLDGFIAALDNITVQQNFKENEIQYYYALANYLKNEEWEYDIYDILRDIAEFCYEADGQAVLKSRALLKECDLKQIEGCLGFRNSTLNHQTDNAKPTEIDLFPNPNQGEVLHLTLPSSSNTDIWKITITDLSGKVVSFKQVTTSHNNITLNIGSLNNGIYFIRFNNNEHKVTKKLIVQRN